MPILSTYVIHMEDPVRKYEHRPIHDMGGNGRRMLWDTVLKIPWDTKNELGAEKKEVSKKGKIASVRISWRYRRLKIIFP